MAEFYEDNEGLIEDELIKIIHKHPSIKINEIAYRLRENENKKSKSLEQKNIIKNDNFDKLISDGVATINSKIKDSFVAIPIPVTESEVSGGAVLVKKKLSDKTLLLAGISFFIVFIVGMSLMFTYGNNKTPQALIPDDVIEIPDPVHVEFVLPMSEFSLGQPASLTELVYSSTLLEWRTHNGIDFLGESGAKVYAIGAGTVIEIEHTTLEASIITIQHENRFVSYYKGLDTFIAVAVGDSVQAGAEIGVLAEDYPIENNAGPHLHLEIKFNGRHVDPAEYLTGLDF